jgi:hypothetical protein
MKAEAKVDRKFKLVFSTFLLLLCLISMRPAHGGVVEVQINLPVLEKIDASGMRRVLVGGFRVNDDPIIDIDVEYRDYMMDLLRKRSRFEIIDADSPPLPEQELAAVMANSSYWKRLGVRFSADLIIAGVIIFDRLDKSGFIQEDIISPSTGQRYRRTRYAEREGFNLAVTLYFFKGETGELLYEQRLTEEAIYGGRGNDPLSILHHLADRSSAEVIGVLMPRKKTETRFLFDR